MESRNNWVPCCFGFHLDLGVDSEIGRWYGESHHDRGYCTAAIAQLQPVETMVVGLEGASMGLYLCLGFHIRRLRCEGEALSRSARIALTAALGRWPRIITRLTTTTTVSSLIHVSYEPTSAHPYFHGPFQYFRKYTLGALQAASFFPGRSY